MNTLLEKISTINDMIIQGKALEAFDQFYHDDEVMQENDNPIVEGKVANRQREEDFFGAITEFRGAQPLKVTIGENTTMVEWHFDYTHKDWGIKNYTQVAVQDWKDGKIIKGEGQGRLCIAGSWPGQMRTVYGDHQRFIDTYFSQYDGKYFTGDGCRRDKDGYYWITGRVDDVIIVSGHNLGTAEIESAFVAHPKVAEAAVVGFPHNIKGNGLYCYVTLNVNESPTGDLERDLKLWVRQQIGPICYPDIIQFAPSLPKTRSGKIMRRILRKIAANEPDNLGDTSTLADPSVVTSLVENRLNKD